jgi:hypothetical protein
MKVYTYWWQGMLTSRGGGHRYRTCTAFCNLALASKQDPLGYRCYTFSWSALCNPKDYHNVQRSPPLNPILGQMNPVYSVTPYSSIIHFNIILPPTSRSPKRSLPLMFSDPNFVCIYCIVARMRRLL